MESQPSSTVLSSKLSKDDATSLLRASYWFHSASDEFITALAATMVPVAAADGHIFVEEGAEVQFFLIVEKGVLARTRYSVEVETLDRLKSSIREVEHEKRAEAIDEHSILIDTIEGRGHSTGVLLSMEKGSVAYTTVMARGSAVVWMVSAEDFRDILSKNGKFALEMMSSMANELRVGKNHLRAMGNHMKKFANEADKDSESNSVLKVLYYDANSWVTASFKPAIEAFNKNQPDGGLQISAHYTTERLGTESATYAAGFDAVCTFVNDSASADVIQRLSLVGVRMIAQRAAGVDRIDTKAARAHGFTVARVPKYSPYAVAEMAVTLLMAVNRKITRATNRVRMANFTLDEGLMGMDIYGKTVGIMGTGNIGEILCKIILGFGAKLICYDVSENKEVIKMGGQYVSKDEILETSDVLFLMMPLLPPTHHTINDSVLPRLKKGMILINTSRGGLVDTKALLEGLRLGIIAGVGMDVYENEQSYFFQDWSARQLQDSDLTALLGNNNVVLTAHQAFFTKEAVDKIVSTTIENLCDFHAGKTGTAHPNNCIPAESKK